MHCLVTMPDECLLAIYKIPPLLMFDVGLMAMWRR